MSKRASGEGSLSYDEGRGLWVGRLPRSLDPRRRAFYAATQGEARDKLRRAVREAEGGMRLDERSRLGDYLESWLSTTIRSRVATGRLAPRTAAGYAAHVRLYLLPRLGSAPVQRLSVAQVEAMLADLQAEGLSPGTARSVRATLSRALTDAMRDEMVNRNVAQLAEPPKLARREPSAFTADERSRIAAACVGDRHGSLFMFAAFTGLRSSELRGLRWGDVDLDAGTFRVQRGSHYLPPSAEAVVGVSGIVESAPKNDASAERLPLSAAALTVLREHRRSQSIERLAAHLWEDPDLVFTTSLGTAYHPSNLNRAWRALLDRAGVPARTADARPRGLHELRRTFATTLRAQGVPLEDVQRLGRWSSPQVLLSAYAASSDDRLRVAAEAAGAAFTTMDPAAETLHG